MVALKCLSRTLLVVVHYLLLFSVQLERYSFWIELFLNSHKPLLISGDVGIGKSSLIEVFCGTVDIIFQYFFLLSFMLYISSF